MSDEWVDAAERALASPPRLAKLGVEWAQDSVLGLPWYAAVTFYAHAPDHALYDLILPDEHETYGCLGLSMRPAHGGQLVVDKRPNPRLDELERFPSFDLDFGGVRRALVDLSSLVPASLPIDTYAAEVHYVGGREPYQCTSSDPTRVRLVAPSKELLAWRDQMRPLLAEKGSWAGVAEALVAAGSTAELAPAHPFAWPMLRALAFVDPAAFAKLHPARFNGWGPPFEPNVRLLYIEWLIARRELARATEEALALRAKSHGLDAAIEALGLDLPPIS